MKLVTNKSDRLFLVGLMGVGKTTLGKTLAKKLGLQFIDCDQELERRTCASVSLIFDVEGETGFRDRESRLLDELTAQPGLLLATGGGAVLRSENRDYLKQRGTVIHLDADLELLTQRTARGRNRPLLEGANPEQMLAKLKEERDPLYHQVADVCVCVDKGNSRHTVRQALTALRNKGYITD
ncbi:MAG: shikimate kinase [Pseudohongiellaceae bacterium]